MAPGRFIPCKLTHTFTKKKPTKKTCPLPQHKKSILLTAPTAGPESATATMRMASACLMQCLVHLLMHGSHWYSTMRWMSSCWFSQLDSRNSFTLKTPAHGYVTQFTVICSGYASTQTHLLWIVHRYIQTDLQNSLTQAMPSFSHLQAYFNSQTKQRTSLNSNISDLNLAFHMSLNCWHTPLRLLHGAVPTQEGQYGDVVQLAEHRMGISPMPVRFPSAARDFSPSINFQCRLAYGVHTPLCTIACMYICVHVKDQVVS